MGKKLALASLFFTSSTGGGGGTSLRSSSSPAPSMSSASSWQWPPSCTQARTTSFRMAAAAEDYGYSTSTMNPAFLDDSSVAGHEHEHTSSRRLSSSSSASSSPAPAPAAEEEAVIRGLRSSSRLFFEPEPTSCILSNSKPAMAFGGATAMAIDSADPYGDFRRSMEEMVLSHGGGEDWGWLEEMLGWYLRANGKKTHGLIVGAFVDLLVALTSSPASSSSSSSFLNCKQSINQS
ncbi:transcription repressor OFP13 [Brachypodium distachyon]|uniref:Transcription repressor n=1 Tax=Brachypodium distachyon TaxID=15368 RepID=I1J3I2_BRADI|nr:transcription repressor OFP13 [Brachypodium distachyon]KQJ85372.1 hypothetical protein BRADI_5g26640v3 [Brachypodium distachyon]|eukprot:XP_014751211.1 transcription repressor OFP13 [Brachypodium distachyon]